MPAQSSLGTSNRELAIDGAAIAVVTGAICLAAHDLGAMSLLVPAVWLTRLIAWRFVAPRTRRAVVAELIFCATATVLGAFNDWSSVDRHHVYRYLVPSDLGSFSSLPTWMLLYWGLILRFVATLALWRGWGEDVAPSDLVRVGRRRITSAPLKVGLQLALMVATRQTIYRAALDPLWSWLPFAFALALHPLLLPWSARERRMAGLALVAGPLIEILYIRVAGLHEYALGWLLGVPLWIALWWVVAVLIWRDLAARALRWLQLQEPAERAIRLA